MAEPRRFVALDVETPNAANDRISAIGLAVVEAGAIVDAWATLVNPERPFAPFNIQLTGITPAMAARAPTLPRLWPQLAPLLASGVLVAHNAPFDLRVLSKCLRAYGLPFPSQADYLCTCQMSRRCLPQLPSHRLDALCQALDIPLAHHQAGSDSLACAELLRRLLAQGARAETFLRRYDFARGRTAGRPGAGGRKAP